MGTTGPLPPAGWYPDPAGTPGQAYWDGHRWGSLPPKRPVNRNQMVIGGAAALVLLVLLSNCGGDDKRSTSSMTSTVTTTVTASVPPSTVTVTVTQAQAPAPDAPSPPAWTGAPSPVWTVPPPTTSTGQAPLLPLPLVPQTPASVYYPNCAAARAAGAAPLYVGEPGYRPGLDRDGDGVACE